ncbi:MAG TPA: hypothetical protein VMM93_10630 [Vicinamibacterales bacterium]|nr:hypothetical protein [Vicinamibacterales bacterium]
MRSKSWYEPDQRHRLRFWALYDVVRHERWGNVNVALLQQAESGTGWLRPARSSRIACGFRAVRRGD